MKAAETLLAQWKELDRRAAEAESAVFNATMNYTRGLGPQPTDAEMENARSLRAQAKVLFERAIEHLDSGASSFGPLQ